MQKIEDSFYLIYCCICTSCRHVVLDEADQMLERGFAESVEEILAASFSESKNTNYTLTYLK